jgi:hypothetical protein
MVAPLVSSNSSLIESNRSIKLKMLAAPNITQTVVGKFACFCKKHTCSALPIAVAPRRRRWFQLRSNTFKKSFVAKKNIKK